MRRLGLCLPLGLGAALALGQAPPADAPKRPEPPSTQRSTPGERGSTPVSAAALLNARLPLIQFDEVPLRDAFSQLGQIIGTNVVVRWQKLAEVGIEPVHPVSVNARNLRLDQILWLILDQIANDRVKLAYRADDNMILVSTADDLGQAMIVKVYAVEDLIMPKLRSAGLFVGRVQQVPIGANVAVANGAVAVQPTIETLVSGVYFGEDPLLPPQPDDVDGNEDQFMQRLIDVITTTIEPDSWTVNGGRGSIVPFRGKLVIRNSPLVQQKIGGLLTTGTP